tara:strand:- start:317 stop:502 length:186 start_codon:yes stop_codon:yes gene_type:complete
MLLDQKDLAFKWLRLRTIHVVAPVGAITLTLAGRVVDADKVGTVEVDAHDVTKKIPVLLSG